MKSSRSTARASYASPAARRCPLWGGSKLPPRSPIRTRSERRGRSGWLDRRCRNGIRFWRDDVGNVRADLVHFVIILVALPQLRAELARVLFVIDRTVRLDETKRGVP